MPKDKTTKNRESRKRKLGVEQEQIKNDKMTDCVATECSMAKLDGQCTKQSDSKQEHEHDVQPGVSLTEDPPGIDSKDGASFSSQPTLECM